MKRSEFKEIIEKAAIEIKGVREHGTVVNYGCICDALAHAHDSHYSRSEVVEVFDKLFKPEKYNTFWFGAINRINVPKRLIALYFFEDIVLQNKLYLKMSIKS